MSGIEFGGAQNIALLNNSGLTNHLVDDLAHRGKVLACVIRQDGAGNWAAINDSVHAPLNVLSITQDATQIRVNYAFTAAKIKTFIVTVDDVLNKLPYVFGGDVGTSYANILIGQYVVQDPVSGLVLSGAGNTLTAVNGPSTPSNGITSMSHTNGVITINHDAVSAPYITPTVVNHGDPKYDAVVSSVSTTQTQLTLRRRGRAKVAFLNVVSNVFSVDVTSDVGYSISSWTGGDLRINTPSIDGWDYNVECSALGVLASVYSVAATTMFIKFYDVVANVQLTTVPNCFITITRTDAGALPAGLVAGDVGFYFSRPKGYAGLPVNPSTIMPVGNNIWVYGLFD